VAEPVREAWPERLTEAEAVLDGERVGEVVTLGEKVPDVVTVRDEVCDGDIEAEAETE